MKDDRRETRESLSSSEGSVISCIPSRATSTGTMYGRNTTVSCTMGAKLCVCVCVCVWVCVWVQIYMAGLNRHVTLKMYVEYLSWTYETYEDMYNVCLFNVTHTIYQSTVKSAHTYSDKRPTASSLHFSTGSESTLRRGFTRNSISPCSTSGWWARLLPTVSRFK